MMDWNFLHSGLATAEADRIRDLLDVRLRLALGRFRGRVTKLVVLLQGGRDPAGSIDKSCRILAHVRGVGEVRGMVVDSDWHTAAERAAQWIGQSVAREIDRARRLPRPANHPISGHASLTAHGERSPLLPEA